MLQMGRISKRNYQYYDKIKVIKAANLKCRRYTAIEIAKILEVSRQTVYRWIKLANIHGEIYRYSNDKREVVRSKYDGFKRGRKRDSILGLKPSQLNEIREIIKSYLPSELNLPYQKPRVRITREKTSYEPQKGEYRIYQSEYLNNIFKRKEIRVEKWYSSTIRELVKLKYDVDLSDYQARKLTKVDGYDAYYRNPKTGKITPVDNGKHTHHYLPY